MKKVTFLLSLFMMIVCSSFAEDITVWEGTKAGNLNFSATATGEDLTNYNALITTAALAEGDVITISYTGADDDKLWLQDYDNWSTYDSSVTGATNDILTDGDGTYTIHVKAAFVEAIKATGLRMRRGNTPAFSFTKVVVTKASSSEGGDITDGTVKVWEGTSSEGSLWWDTTSTEFNTIFGNGSGQANVVEGDKLRVYYTGSVGEGSEIWIQANWDGVGFDQTFPAGDGYVEFTFTEAIIAKFKEGGMRLRRKPDAVYTLTKIEVIKAKQEQSDGKLFTIWEGTSDSGSLYWAPESAEYNKVFGDGNNQANMVAGDILRWYYTGAANESQIWVQANWDGVGIDGSTPTLADGDGSCEFVMTQSALDMYKENGIRFRRPTDAVYTLTKIEVEKAVDDPNVKKPEADEDVLWEGNENKDYTMSFRYSPAKETLLEKMVVGKYFNLYLSNVEEGDKVFFKECSGWDYLNQENVDLVAGRQVFSYQITQDWIDKVNAGGMVIQQHDENVYDYTFRYLTISDQAKEDSSTGIAAVNTQPSNLNSVVYNLAGQRVSANYKGIIIVNGKKVVK